MMIIDKVFYDLCSNVGSPVSLGLWLKFRYAPNELARTTIDPKRQEIGRAHV